MKLIDLRRFIRRIITILQNLQYRNKHNLNPSPLFVLGNQKSGTTAIAGLLALATDKTVALDLPGLNEPVISRIYDGKISFKQTVERYLYIDFCKEIIKEPLLTFLYEDELRKLYPESRFIFIIRHPLQNIRSQLNWIEVSGKEQDLDLNNSNITPERLRVFTNADLNFNESHLIKNLALRWNYCAQLYLTYPNFFLLVKYEDFTANKKNYIEELANTLGTEVKNDISDKTDFRFQPQGNTKVDLREFFGLENYNLIVNICQPLMKKIGYTEET